MIRKLTGRRFARVLLSVITGAFAVIMLAGGVSSTLVAGKIEKAFDEPYQSLLIWGVFGLACVAALVSGVWGARRPKDSQTGPSITGSGNVAGRDITAVRDVVARDVYNIYQPTGPPTPSQALHQLPRPSADFTGRVAELAELAKKVQGGAVAIFGLRGMGGIGKTALALVLARQLAPRYPDAQIFLDLLGTSSQPLTPAEAMAHVIRSFDPQARPPESEAELGARYRSALHSRRALLLMDNAADADQVRPLIPPQGCLLLVTSRRRFDLPGLSPLDLEALSDQEAQELLLRICPRIGDEADAIARLCGNLPMALELAARALNETPNLTPEKYRARLEDASQRFERVDASLDLSYQLLTPELQRQWRALAVFPGAFDLPAAAAVWAIDEDAAQEALGGLLAYSLLGWPPEARRYRLHDLARLCADARLERGERAPLQRRHAAHFRDVLLAAAALYLKGGEKMMAGLALFDREWGNIQAGQAWAASHAKQKVGAALCSGYPGAAHILGLRLHPRERIRWLEAALAAARRLGDRPAEGRHLGNLGLAYADLGDPRRAIEHYEQALAIFHEIGDRRSEGNALGSLGNVYLTLGEPRRAIEHYEQALAISHEIGDRRSEGNALGSLGNAYLALGEPRRAIEYHEQALAISHETGDRRSEGNALGNLGLAYANLGDPRHAIEYHEQALAISHEIGDRWGEGQDLGNLGLAYAELGDPRRAIDYYEQQLGIAHEIGDRLGEGRGLWNTALALDQLGDRAQAIQRAQEALPILEQVEHPVAPRVRERLAQWRGEK